MEIKDLYRDIIRDHNLYQDHKKVIAEPDLVLNGVNPSCGDDITLQLKLDGNVITEGAFTGSGCAISQASADLMLELVTGKTKEEALRLADLFSRMIRSEASREEIEELEEAGALESISHMPARVKCALLGWRTIGEMLGKSS